MPLRFTDLPMLLGPVPQAGSGLAAINAVYANALTRSQQKEMQRYHDMMDERLKSRIENLEVNRRKINEQKKRKMALDILKAKVSAEQDQRDAREKTLLDAQKLSLVDPMAAQALLANRGLLAMPPAPAPTAVAPGQAPPAQQIAPAAPTAPPPPPRISLPQAAIDAGISPEQIAADIAPLQQLQTPTFQEAEIPPVPVAREEMPPEPTPPVEGYSVEVGGKRFDFSRQEEFAKRAKSVESLFQQMEKFTPERNAEIAKQVLEMAPMAVEATGGDTESATNMLMDFYLKSIPKEKARKGIGAGIKAKVGAKPSAGKKSIEMYKYGKDRARAYLKDSKYFDEVEAVDNIKLARKKLLTGGSTDHREAIILMAKALQKGRLSDKDVEIAEGFKSIQQEVERFFAIGANKEAKLPKSIIQPLLRALDNSLESKYGNIKSALTGLKDLSESSHFREEEIGTNTYLEPQIKKFSGLMKPKQKSAILDKLESKYAGK